MTVFEQQVCELEDKIAQKEKLEKELPSLYEQQSLCRNRAKTAEERVMLAKEQVARLEKGGIQTLFYSLFGSRQETIKQAKQEYLQLKAQWDETLAEQQAADEAVDACEKAIYDLDGADRELMRIQKEKERQVRASDSPVNKEIAELESRIAELQEWVQELDVAMQSGEEVIETLEDMLKHLDEAIQCSQENSHRKSDISELYNDYIIYNELKLMNTYYPPLKLRAERFRQLLEHASSLNVTQPLSCDMFHILSAVATDSFLHYKYFTEFHGRLTELRGYVWRELDDLGEQKQAVEQEQNRLREEIRRLINQA